MIPLIVVALYLAVIAYIGAIAFRKGKENTEDFFLAGRSIGPMVFFLSIFATNMTAFAILGSSGVAYRQGMGIFGLMASSSALVIPVCIFVIGTRLWWVGKRFGHMTQVQFFRDRWECSGTGTAIFLLSAAMLLPYMIISIVGGGRVLNEISIEPGTHFHYIPYWFGAFLVALVVTINVFFGGMRGVVWVNVFQTLLFLCFGAIAVMVISSHVPGGFEAPLSEMAKNPKLARLLARGGPMDPRWFWSYTLIPLSSIMFPHMAIMCFSARRLSAFKRTVVLYPLAIMVIWLPCVFLGMVGADLIPNLKGSAPDGILLMLLGRYATPLLAGILGAGIISAVMGSDCHQVLALSTMFTKDIFEHYGGKVKYGEKGEVIFARIFILGITTAAYLVALTQPPIFELATRWAFAGFAAMAPIMVAALFWKRSTKYGALAATVFVIVSVVGTAVLGKMFEAGTDILIFGGHHILYMAALPKENPNLTFMGFAPVFPMVVGSALFMIVGSLLSAPPSRKTIDRYFPARNAAADPDAGLVPAAAVS